ncbi:unnamed protein product [Musa acuminata subsp. malaccensis]|uniref:(wild Malaysian banana) hypothetical protein n=1 Tax=Musa acuminata subsp. malaccensis TaxID=214687 RepID=A0A804HNX5_MUSAM|nr:PREDICTED: protein GLUTAMINE DUMPER 3-like [Musa acuminata subsp. malaccensis]CAG1858191.1 unnamed protein product [Musa acuminata subsp. malaccensis]
MRSGGEFNTSGGASAAKSPSPASSGPPHSSWQSPVPYLFCALAVMLGLIGFAFLILACSYWKLASYLESGNDRGARDREVDGPASGGDAAKPPPLCEESVVVIMAGDCKPTFLATPVASRAATSSDEGDDTREAATEWKNKDSTQRQGVGNSSEEQGVNQQ